MDLFSWKPEHMLGINPKIIAHKLNFDHTKKLAYQRKRRFVRKKSDIIKIKIDSLKRVGWVWKVDYPTWLSNMVQENKARDDHCICFDFTDVNTTTPKDCFPL